MNLNQEIAIHQACIITGIFFFLLGLLFILAHKIEHKRSLVPATIHSVLGSSVAVATIVQSLIGLQKVQYFHYNKMKALRFHGDLGLIIWDIICTTVIFGLIEILPFAFSTLLAITLPFIVWLSVIVQVQYRYSNRREETASPTEDDDETTPSLDTNAVSSSANSRAVYQRSAIVSTTRDIEKVDNYEKDANDEIGFREDDTDHEDR